MDAGLSGTRCTSTHPLQCVLGVQVDAGDVDAGLNGVCCPSAHTLQCLEVPQSSPCCTTARPLQYLRVPQRGTCCSSTHPSQCLPLPHCTPEAALSSGPAPISEALWVLRRRVRLEPAAPLTPHPTDPPRPPVLTLLQEPHGGGLAVLRCVVDSHPPAVLALYHGDNLVATSSSPAAPGRRRGVTAARNALRMELRDVRLQDSGTYRCTATNALGSASVTRPFVTRGEWEWGGGGGGEGVKTPGGLPGERGLGWRKEPKRSSGFNASYSRAVGSPAGLWMAVGSMG